MIMVRQYTSYEEAEMRASVHFGELDRGGEEGELEWDEQAGVRYC